MPYRSDPSLWFNLPGVVASWQPVAAPGPLLARYNQAHGGSNLHRATDGITASPTWMAHTGWMFNGVNENLITSVVPSSTAWSVLVCYSATGSGTRAVFGHYAGGAAGAFLLQVTDTAMDMYNGADYPTGYLSIAGAMTSGVYGIAGKQPYRNGVAETSTIPAGTATGAAMWIGALYSEGQYFSGSQQAFLVAERTLSPVEVWQASRQMVYCHVNPEWSAWGRRRRYYYAPIEPPVTTADDIRLAAAGVGAFGPRLGGAARMGYQQAAELPAAARAGHRSRLNG